MFVIRGRRSGFMVLFLFSLAGGSTRSFEGVWEPRYGGQAVMCQAAPVLAQLASGILIHQGCERCRGYQYALEGTNKDRAPVAPAV